MDMIASAVGMKTTTPMIPHSIPVSSIYAFISLFVLNMRPLAEKTYI